MFCRVARGGVASGKGQELKGLVIAGVPNLFGLGTGAKIFFKDWGWGSGMGLAPCLYTLGSVAQCGIVHGLAVGDP